MKTKLKYILTMLLLVCIFSTSLPIITAYAASTPKLNSYVKIISCTISATNKTAKVKYKILADAPIPVELGYKWTYPS